MDAAVIAHALVALAIAVPWLTLLPLHGAVAVAAHAVTLVAAFHGAGLVVARLAGPRAATPLLIIQWGIAALIGLSGAAIALRVGTLASHAVLVFGAVAVHSASLGLGFADHVERVADRLAGPRTWLVPVALLAGLGTLAVLGAAGEALARPFDDEAHLLGQLRRLLDTGALGDPVGYPRRAQLGAQLALGALASGAGDELARTLEPLAMVLALGLAVARIRPRDASAALWAMLLITTAFGLALAPTDPLPCWTAVGLILALYTMLEDDAPALPLAVTAGALAALRHELAPIAAVALACAWWRRRGDRRATAILVGGALAVALPFVVARMLAWRSISPAAAALLAPPAQAALVLRLVLAAAIAVPAAGILRLMLPTSRGLATAALATAAALGALVARVTGTGPYSLRLVWPIAIGFAVLLVIELARARRTGPTIWITVLAMALLIHEGRVAPARLRWSRRMSSLTGALEALHRAPALAADPYAGLLAGVPDGATVAVWVNEPERLDHARLRIFDLRTPAGARLRDFRWAVHRSRAEPLLAALAAGFLLIEQDDAAVQRTQGDLLYRWLCRTPQPICADDLEAIARTHPVVARHANLALVALRPAR